MEYGKAFFDLQLRFAQAARALAGISLERAVMDYTNVYIRFGLGRDFDARHAAWREYADGLVAAPDIGDWTYRHYLRLGADRPGVDTSGAVSGCFSYVMQDAATVRLHFRNAEPAPASPLSGSRLPLRIDELRSLFHAIRRDRPAARRVAGTSWLYNLPAYRRCFPADYVGSLRLAGDRFRNVSLWGQFLRRDGALRAQAVREFEAGWARAGDVRDLAACFPLRALAAEAPIAAFYRHYGIAQG
ncbi:hypothetical protein [Achromobacter dolens]|uniref:hypothetical protein n=1 Tax=Achromobacter dolens TaxID=1287738 RepID=UPI000A46903D|nr:hypothetical protein [Achromobacter dolens]MBQ2647030.1 hypothetical protein [Achromobacter sp.]